MRIWVNIALATERCKRPGQEGTTMQTAVHFVVGNAIRDDLSKMGLMKGQLGTF